MDLLQTKLNICEGEDGTESSLGDVLIFPDMIRGLTHFDVDNFVEEVLVKDVEWLLGSPEVIRGSYVFVCAHGSKDKRCGVCGPALITRFKEEIEGQDLDGQVAVSGCSHMGAHKYAGNVIIFSSDAKGEVTGHWYGYITPDDVPVLLQKHIGQEEIVDHLWRFLPLESSNKVRISRSKVIPRPQASGLSESAIGYNYSDPIYYMLAYFI